MSIVAKSNLLNRFSRVLPADQRKPCHECAVRPAVGEIYLTRTHTTASICMTCLRSLCAQLKARVASL